MNVLKISEPLRTSWHLAAYPCCWSLSTHHGRFCLQFVALKLKQLQEAHALPARLFCPDSSSKINTQKSLYNNKKCWSCWFLHRENLKLCISLFAGGMVVPYEGQSYAALKRRCRQNGSLFEDLLFPASDQSLFYQRNRIGNVVWKRPQVRERKTKLPRAKAVPS